MPGVKLNGRVFLTGSVVTFNENADKICCAPTGLRVLIHRIKGDGLIGLYSPDKRLSNWGDLDGDVGDNRGWWTDAGRLEKCIIEGDSRYEVSKDFEYRGVNLINKSCRIVASLDNGTVFVEFDENVNGCSADGLGKSGYCVALNSKILTTRTINKQTKQA